jgi:hypothetical protein
VPKLLGVPRHSRAYFCQGTCHHRIVDRQLVRVAYHLIDLKARHLEPEIISRDVLDEVGFVKYNCAVIRYDPAVLVSSHGEVRKKQMVVDNNDIGVLGPRTHPRDKARLKVGTFLPETYLGTRIDAVPKRKVFRQVLQLGAVARSRFA